MSHKTLKANNLTNADIKYLKGIGHQLNPIVLIGNNGITPAVIEEIARALFDHELIKVKIPAGSKEEREAVVSELAEATGSVAVTSIGRVCLLLKQNPDANPKLSNLSRYAE